MVQRAPFCGTTVGPADSAANRSRHFRKKKRCESINLMFLQSGISDPSEKRQILRLMKLASHNFGENLRDQAGLTAPLPLRVAVRRTATPITAAALRLLCSHPPQTAQCSRHSRHGWRVVRVLSDSL